MNSEHDATCEMIDPFTGETMGHIHHQVPAPVEQPPFGFFRCLSCGFNGTISNDEIAKHRVQCSHGPTVPMSQAEWEARGGPAPVAQVDADKCDVCGEVLEFPSPDDPAYAGDTAVTSKCRHTIRAVAQVDAGKCKCGGIAVPNASGGITQTCIRCGAIVRIHAKPAVAQTELPPMAPYDADVETARKLTDDHAWGPWTQLTVRERQLRDSIATIASLTQRLQEQEAECARRKAQYDDIQREIFNSHTEYETQLTALQASHDALLDAVKIYRVAPIRTFPVIRAIDTAIATAEKLRGHTDDKPNKNC